MRKSVTQDGARQQPPSLEHLFSESPLSNLLEAVPCVLFTFQLTGTRSAIMPYASNRLTEITGLEHRDITEDAAPFLNSIHPDDVDTFFATAEKSLRTMTPWHLEFRISHPSNNVTWLEWRATPCQQDDELLWQGVMLDITERHRMEEELRRREQAFLDLAENSPDFIIHYDLERRIRYINAKLVHELGLTHAEEALGRRPDEIWPDKRFSLIEETVRKVIDTGKKTTIELKVPRNDGSLSDHEVFVVPKYDVNEKLIGTMIYGRDITTHKQAAREMTRLQHAVNVSADGIFIAGEQTHFVDVNEAACRSLGYSREELLTMTPMDIDPDITKEQLEQMVMACGEGKTVRLETQHRAKDGHTFPVEIIISPFMEDGKLHALNVVRDITKRKQTEKEMQRLRHAIDVSVDGIFIADDHNRFVDVNASACNLLGYSRNELLGKTALDFNPDITKKQVAEYTEQGRDGQSIRFETRHQAKDGRVFPVEITASPFMENGSAYGISVVRDITERKQAEQEMRRLQNAINVSSDSIFIIGEEARFVDVNETACRSLGYSREELLQKTLQEIDPDLTDEHLAKLVEMSSKGLSLTLETRHKTADGHIFPVEIASAPFFEEGKRYTVTTARDISKRKQDEERLRMAASVFETAREGIIITDPEGLICDTNPAFSDITGYTREEVTGKTPAIISSGQHDRQFYKTMWLQLETEGTWSGEITNRRKDGEIYTEHLHIVAVYDETKKLKHYIGVFSDISLIKKQERHLRHIAHHDTLTNLPNRPSLTSQLSRSMAPARQQNQMIAILYLDLDGFKPINDHYGSETGDHVLIKIARRLMKSLRPNDTVARIGGDEFVVILNEVTDNEECEITASRLLDVVAKPITVDGHVLNLTASIGIYVYPGHMRYDADTLLRYADQAMYHAKSAGRNQYVFYESNSKDDSNNDQKVYDLRTALAEDQISVHYQPIIDPNTGNVVKAEALVRWYHPKLGMVPPSEFIPIAENVGLIHDIGDLVFKQAARVAHIWNNQYAKEEERPLRISVNRSARQFFHRNGVDAWTNYLDEQSIPGELLSVEITESLLLDNLSNVMAQLDQLRNKGLDVLLDDFGTGYSSLSYLKKFDIDYLKIDRSFVKDSVDDPDYQAIIKSIIAMANQLGIKTIGEGVETQDQVKLLQEFGCDLIQGFLYARPMPEEEFLAFIAAGPVRPRE